MTIIGYLQSLELMNQFRNMALKFLNDIIQLTEARMVIWVFELLSLVPVTTKVAIDL